MVPRVSSAASCAQQSLHAPDSRRRREALPSPLETPPLQAPPPPPPGPPPSAVQCPDMNALHNALLQAASAIVAVQELFLSMFFSFGGWRGCRILLACEISTDLLGQRGPPAALLGPGCGAPASYVQGNLWRGLPRSCKIWCDLVRPPFARDNRFLTANRATRANAAGATGGGGAEGDPRAAGDRGQPGQIIRRCQGGCPAMGSHCASISTPLPLRSTFSSGFPANVFCSVSVPGVPPGLGPAL